MSPELEFCAHCDTCDVLIPATDLSDARDKAAQHNRAVHGGVRRAHPVGSTR